MKTIVVIKPARGRAYGLLRHCFLSVGRQGNVVESINGESDRVYGLINGLAEGGLIRNASTDARSLIADLPQNRAEVRHVISSMEDTADPDERKNAFYALADLGEEFAAKYAPQTPYVGVIHQDKLHPHVHLIFKNSQGTGEEALTWNRDTLIEMQSMTWVSEDTKEEFSIEPGRSNGRTQREGTGMPYPLASSLDAMTLANATIQQLEEYESADILNIKRLTPSAINSVEFDGREIRTSTIRFLRAYTSIPTPPSKQPPSIAPRRNRRMVRQRPSPTPHIA
jgi:hypothetical protein